MSKPSEILTTRLIEPEWIVQDMIPRDSMVIIAGDSGTGKSSLMYCLIYAIASGRPFLGHQTFPTTVVYFDEENSHYDYLQYNQWAWVGNGSPPFEQIDKTLNIEHFQLLSGWKKPLQQAMEGHPGLVIIDTASSAFDVTDENANAEAGKIIKELRLLRMAANNKTTFIVLKHEKQRSETSHRRTVRGAKIWEAAFDQVIYHVIAPGAKLRKDGTRKTVYEPGKLRAFALRSSIGIDPSFTETTPKGLIIKTYSPKET